MPVLKQLFNKWGFIIKDDWDRDTLVISYDKFIELQKEWLKQDLPSESNAYVRVYIKKKIAELEEQHKEFWRNPDTFASQYEDEQQAASEGEKRP